MDISPAKAACGKISTIDERTIEMELAGGEGMSLFFHRDKSPSTRAQAQVFEQDGRDKRDKQLVERSLQIGRPIVSDFRP
jgi:hypothetical protein